MNFLSQAMFNDSIFDSFVPSYGTHNAWELVKSEDGYVLNIEVPGLSKNEIEIEVEGDSMQVRGKREEGSIKHVVNKRFNLENLSVDYDRVSAICENGILKINLPSPEEALPKKRSIKID